MLRMLLVVVGGLALLVALAIVVLLNASFQTALARWQLHEVDPRAEVAQVSLGLGGGEVDGLVVHARGRPVSVQKVTLSYSWSNLLFGPVRTLDHLELQGVEVDASGASQIAVAESVASAGVVAADPPSAGTNWPAILIRDLSADGTVALPGQRSVAANLTGHDLGAGGTGAADLQGAFQDPAPGAAVSGIHLDSHLDLACDAQMHPQTLALSANLSAVMAGQAQPAQLRGRVTSEQNGAAHPFQFELTQPGAGGARLLAGNGTWQNDGSCAGQFSVNCTRAQIGAVAAFAAVPNFNAQGAGQFSLARGAGSLQAALDLRALQFEKSQPALAALGPVQLSAAVDASWDGENLSAQSFSLLLGPDGAPPALALQLLKPLSLAWTGTELKITRGAGPDLMRLDLNQLPPAWLDAVLPAGWTLTGGNLSGHAVAGADESGTLVAQTNPPLQLDNFNIARGGQPWLAAATLQLDAAAEIAGGKLQVNLRRLGLSAGSTGLLQLDGNLTYGSDTGVARVDCTGRLAVLVDQLAQQPLGASWIGRLPPGSLRLDSTFAVSRLPNAIEADAIEANLTQDQASLLTFKLLQPITIPAGAESGPPDANGDLAVVQTDALPIALLDMFLPAGAQLSGDPGQGRLVVAGAGPGAGWTLRADQPLTFAHSNYAEGDRALLADANLTLAPQGTWTADGWQTNVQVQASAVAGTFFNGTLAANQTSDGQLTTTVSLSGDLAALGAQPLGAAWRALLPASPPQFALNATFVRAGTTTTVQSFQAFVSAAAGGPAMADIRLLQPVPFSSASGASGWPTLDGDVLAMKLNALPLGVLSLIIPTYALSGQTATADLVLHGDGAGAYTVTSNQPLNVGDLTVRHQPDDALIVDNLTVAGVPTVKFSNAGVLYFNAPDLDLASSGETLAQGALELTLTAPAQARLNLSGNVAQLLQQPFLRAYDNLTSGRATLAGQLQPGGDFQLSAQFTNWQARGGNRVVKTLNLSAATGKFGPAAGTWQLTAPVTADGPDGPTDCTLKLAVAPAPSGQTFDLDLSGDSLVADDLEDIVHGFQPAAAARASAPSSVAPAVVVPEFAQSGEENETPLPGAPATPVGTVPNPAPAPGVANPATAVAPVWPPPFWGALTGNAAVDLKRFVVGTVRLENPHGQANVTPQQVTLGNFSAVIANGTLNASAAVSYDPANSTAEPYALQAKVSLTGFNVAQYFREHAPRQKPPMEGTLDFAGVASGQGADANDLAQRVQFDFTLNSTNGTFNVLDTAAKNHSEELTLASDFAGMVGIAAGMAGKNGPTEVKQFNELVTLLGTIPYNKLTCETKRGPDLNINITQFEARSAELDVTGSGQVAYRPHVPIPNQSLRLTMQIAAGGQTAALFSSLGLMDAAAANSEGYAPGPAFYVNGTLQHPDFNSLYNVLVKAAMNGMGRRLLGG
jgi:hypothetical protein